VEFYLFVDPPARVFKKRRTMQESLDGLLQEDSDKKAVDRPRRPRSQPFSLAAAIELKARRIPDSVSFLNTRSKENS
jgi:hypothetical protein